MKKIIINNYQLFRLNEDVANISAPTTGTSKDAYIKAAKDANPEAVKAQQLGVDTSVVVTNSENDSGENAPTFIATGDNLATAAASVPDAVYQQGHNVQFPVGITNEGKCFTKKMLEEVRLNNMRKNGRIFTKKELINSITNKRKQF
jgi:hypothetical protein